MNLLKKIFSISNEKHHWVWCILSVKFKFKNNHIEEPYLANGNKIIIHKLDGSIEYPLSYKGIQIDWAGKNSIVELWEPINIHNSSFILGNDCNISIKSSKLLITNLVISMPYSNSFRVSIGENFSVNQMLMQIHRTHNLSINIGDDCMFSSGIFIMPYDAHTVYDIRTNEIVNKHKKGINIGNHVWLCQNTSILKDVNIPSNTVVAYGSVVTKSLTDENVIIAGNLAKIVKKNVNWSRDWIEKYEQNILNNEDYTNISGVKSE